MTRVLVTGATGTIGKQVVAALQARGATVRAGARHAPRLEGAEGVALDLSTGAGLAAALEGVDAAFCLAPFVEDMVAPVETFIAHAQAAKLPFVLKLSAAGAATDAGLALARQHGAGDAALQASGLAYAVLRPTFFQENIANFHAESIRTSGAFYGASAGQKTAYISARDIGEAAAAILLNPAAHRGQTYDISGPEALADTEVAALLSAIVERDVKYVNLTPEVMRSNMAQASMPQWLVDGLVGLEGVKAAGYAAATLGQLGALLSREPTRMHETLRLQRTHFA